MYVIKVSTIDITTNAYWHDIFKRIKFQCLYFSSFVEYAMDPCTPVKVQQSSCRISKQKLQKVVRFVIYNNPQQ